MAGVVALLNALDTVDADVDASSFQWEFFIELPNNDFPPPGGKEYDFWVGFGVFAELRNGDSFRKLGVFLSGVVGALDVER